VDGILGVRSSLAPTPLFQPLLHGREVWARPWLMVICAAWHYAGRGDVDCIASVCILTNESKQGEHLPIEEGGTIHRPSRGSFGNVNFPITVLVDCLDFPYLAQDKTAKVEYAFEWEWEWRPRYRSKQ